MDLRSAQDADGGGSVQAVAGHQVGDVVLDLGLLTRKAGSLKQLGPGRVVVLWPERMSVVEPRVHFLFRAHV